MTPLWPFVSGSRVDMRSEARRITLKVPVVFTWRTLENISREWGPLRPRVLEAVAMPAQEIAAFTAPKLDSARSKAAATSSGEVTSQGENLTLSLPRSEMILSASSAWEGRSQIIAFPPEEMMRSTVARPRPEAEPVTREMVFFSIVCVWGVGGGVELVFWR